MMTSDIPARSFIAALGGPHGATEANVACPVCQPERRQDQRALSVSEGSGRLLVFCHKSSCSYRDILTAAGFAELRVAQPVRAGERQTERKRTEYERLQLEKARALWRKSKPIAGTPGEAYLRRRRITCPMPGTLRWADDAFHGPSGRSLSAMIADVSTGGVHRTFFEDDGSRLNKMMLGPCAGGAVRLSVAASGPLVVCEGIETGLSLLSGLLDGPATVWAALSTSGMVGLHLPRRADRLVIAEDGDDAGRKASQKLGARAVAMGWQVTRLTCPEGHDFNDML